jgi:hypothetical protein
LLEITAQEQSKGTGAWDQSETRAWDQSTGSEHGIREWDRSTRPDGPSPGRTRVRNHSTRSQHRTRPRDQSTGSKYRTRALDQNIGPERKTRASRDRTIETTYRAGDTLRRELSIESLIPPRQLLCSMGGFSSRTELVSLQLSTAEIFVNRTISSQCRTVPVCATGEIKNVIHENLFVN